MKFGAHVSIAGGVWNAPKNAADLQCETFQMFTRSPQGGNAKAIDRETEKIFKTEMEKYGFKDFVVHAPYYINFGSDAKRIYEASIRIVREELERSHILGAQYVMFHPGSAGTRKQQEVMPQVIRGIKKVLNEYKGKTQLLIEISAGAGNVIGDTFEELASILNGLGHYLGKSLGGICFDTQHAFGAGYDLRTHEGWKNVLTQFDKLIGLEYLKMSHMNDSKVKLGEHKDRHEHIGKGYMGIEAFRTMLFLDIWKNKLLILETEHDLVDKDLALLKKLRNKL